MVIFSGPQIDQGSLGSNSSSKRRVKQESFDSEHDFASKDENFHQIYQSTDLKRMSERTLRKFESRLNADEFLELDEAFNQPSDSECSVDSKKVETDSLCLEDDDYTPAMIQQLKYDYNSNRSEDNFGDLHPIDQKEDLIALSPGIMDNLSRIRTSTKKEDSASLEVICSAETSLAGSSQELSDDATISDSESISNLRTSIKSKVYSGMHFPDSHFYSHAIIIQR